MGGLLSSPSPAAPVAVPEPVDTEAEERKRRLEDMDRRRRGRSGTIATGYRGILNESRGSAGKSLLGE
ncbi:hypothetical protein HH303_15315 [Rhodospirillaceae bacterium KN72]|uniref:Uncharacterized protein n=1 Tax=Pacificispira spongiicola TaxID=2729598 RepID=A0A7Y0E261_9PROT|nr:hypothetical protein [Pacificispira spongiicola]NMM45865.1 hypothetical protein [Pacificispira spongiicola]